MLLPCRCSSNPELRLLAKVLERNVGRQRVADALVHHFETGVGEFSVVHRAPKREAAAHALAAAFTQTPSEGHAQLGGLWLIFRYRPRRVA
jgi:hypothetical protein